MPAAVQGAVQGVTQGAGNKKKTPMHQSGWYMSGRRDWYAEVSRQQGATAGHLTPVPPLHMQSGLHCAQRPTRLKQAVLTGHYSHWPNKGNPAACWAGCLPPKLTALFVTMS